MKMETPRCPNIPNYPNLSTETDWKLNPNVECRIILNKLKIKTPEYGTMEFCRMLTNRSVGSVPTEPRVTMFECDICSSMYSSPSMLIRHRNTHWNPLTTRSEIPDRSRISISPSFDMSSVSRTNEGVSSGQCENHPLQPVPVPAKNFEWNFLKQESSESQSELQISNPKPLGILQHMNHLSTIQNNLKQECDDLECEEDLSDPLLLQDLQVPSFVKSECTEISTESERRTILMTHEKSSNDTPTGRESFPGPSDLIRHKITHTNSTGQNPHKCDRCGKCFRLLQQLTQHKIVHTRERPLECNVCGQGFSRKFLLIRHRLTHTVEKSFGCDECGRHFVFKNSLAVHKLTHTGDKDKPKLHTCELCGQTFYRPSELTRHKLVHTGEKRQECNECGKRFASKSALRIHKIIHTGERPYKCDVCGKSFRQSSSLKPHALTHIGEKSFQCDVCGQRFVGHYDYELTKHKIMHILESTNTTLVNNLKEDHEESEEEECQEDPLLIPEMP